MKRSVLVIRLILATVATAATLPSALAEVSVDVLGNRVNTIVMSITDDSDPLGHHAWRALRAKPGKILNAEGFARQDGPPDIAIHPVTGYPAVTWAYNNGSEFDIAFSEWDGTAWTPIEFLSSGHSNDLDPTLLIEPDGTTSVTWWTDDFLFDDVYVRTRATGSDQWSSRTEVTRLFENGERPSIAVGPSGLLVGYGHYNKLVVSGLIDNVFLRLVVTVLQFGESDVCDSNTNSENDDDDGDDWGCPGPSELSYSRIHSSAGFVWNDWKASDSQFGYAQLKGDKWSTPTYIPWKDFSWVGLEQARAVVRGLVVGDNIPKDGD